LASPAFAAAIKPVKPDFATLKGLQQPAISVSLGSVTMRHVTLKDVIVAGVRLLAIDHAEKASEN
jgi:hypothetical protein